MSAHTPYYDSGAGVVLYLGDCREILPQLDVQADCCVTDPPYGETSLAWDKWPDGWPTVVAAHTRSMWCFGSLRMFLDRRDEFAGWKLSQDTVGEFEIDTMVWEKHIGSGFTKDRLKKVHELACHWYRGPWGQIHHETPRVPAEFNAKGRTTSARSDDRAAHTGSIKAAPYVDDGLRLVRSVIRAKSPRGNALHSTEKPVDILTPLISYACPPGGLVLDPFAGSGSTLVAARDSGRHAVGIEADERYAEVIARRLGRGSLFAEVTP